MYAVGFGNGIGMAELMNIAGDESKVKLVRNLKDLEEGMTDLSVKVCEKVRKLTPWMVGLAPKWVRLHPKLDKYGTFSDQISVHLAR